MAIGNTKTSRKAAGDRHAFVTKLRKGDPVMVISGGNSAKGKALAGKTGKILRFLAKRERVVVEGVKIIKRHKRAQSANDSAGILEKEGSVHISNVLYYHEDSKRAVRLCSKVTPEGRKVRGFIDPRTKQFVQIDAV
jgi:large subunit ribosomal protein L24